MPRRTQQRERERERARERERRGDRERRPQRSPVRTRMRRAALAASLAPTLLVSPGARADAPWPRCEDVPGCSDASDYADYLRSDVLPDDFGGGGAWKFLPVTGLNVVGAWAASTGRPDVRVAVLDSGVRWREPDLARKAALNTDELPVPTGCAPPTSPLQQPHDCNGDGIVNVDDFAGQSCPGGVVADTPDDDNDLLDPGDLLRLCSDGVDGWGGDAAPVANGFVDDIAGWDFVDDDNDPLDDVDYGHGTGEALGSTGEANNGAGGAGVAPSATFVPLRVADSFVAAESDFAQAVVYAVDLGVDVVSEALGAVNGSRVSQAAIDYAYARGVPVVASAADEESRHHNLPAAFEHTLWVNSIRDGDGTIGAEPGEQRYDVLNGCTNYGGRAWVAISSSACSSEATERAAGLAALLISHGRNLVERGEIEPWDAERGVPFSAEEVRQLFRASADDVDHEDDLTLLMDPLLASFLSGAGHVFGSTRFPTQAGWDQYTGYGRPDAARLLALADGDVPPEADLSGGPRWFDVIDPTAAPRVPLLVSAAADREGGSFSWRLETGCGVQPTTWSEVANGFSLVRLERTAVAEWDPAATAAGCGFDPAANVLDPDETDPNAIPDAHTVTLRLRVVDRLGRVGEDRRTLAIHHDPSWHVPPLFLGTSGESAPALADVDRDGVLDVVWGTADGAVHVLDGDGRELPGFPVRTDPVAVHPSPAWEGEDPSVPRPHEGVVAAVAADDLDGDGRTEIVAAGLEGRLYVWDDQGRLRSGFPVTTDPAFSSAANRDRCNDTDRGLASAPTLADLDPPGVDPALEILVGGLDGHLYAWRADGSPQPGFPVRVADRAKLAVDDATGTVTPLDAAGTPVGCDASGLERLAKILSSPSVGDLDGDGRVEIVVATNEEYGDGHGFATDSFLLALLLGGGFDLGDLDTSTAGRVYALYADGEAHRDAAGRPAPFLPGWPVEVPLLQPQVLPTVATGVPGSPALADLDPSDGDPSLSVAIFGSIGPVVLLGADGEPRLGRDAAGLPRVLATDFPAPGFPFTVPPGAGSADAPFFGALGSGAFGDVDGDGRPEYAAPTGGIRQLVDVAAPGRQEFGDHQVTLWNPRTGGLVGPDASHAVFPQPNDDMQFLGGPSLADVDGDGRVEVVTGSGAYLVRAYRSDGTQPTGWPKFTHGWLIGAPTPGDVDGDGLLEWVALSREGRLFVWDTTAPDAPGAVAWQGFGRDRRNSGNLASGVPTRAAPGDALGSLAWDVEALARDFRARFGIEKPGGGLWFTGQALGMAAEALARGDLTDGAVAAFQAWIALGESPLLAEGAADLRERLGRALAEAATLALPEVPCDPTDATCGRDVWRARLARADVLAAEGREFEAQWLRVALLVRVGAA